MGTPENQPNWNEIAEQFDLWLPQLKPSSIALLNVLAVQPGDRVLDIASGTGEPSLTLAKRSGQNLEIIGIDTSEAMVRVANAKAEAANYAKENIKFSVMPVENLEFQDKYFNKAMSRFGIMLIEDPMHGIKEIFRVLKIGGRFVYTVWSTPEKMQTLKWLFDACKGKIPDAALPPLYRATMMCEKVLVSQMMQDAGFQNVSVMAKELKYQFDSFDHYWSTLEKSGIAQRQFNELNTEQMVSVRNEISTIAHQYITSEGLIIPHEYLMVSGVK